MEKKYWSSRIKDIVPYVPGEQPQDKRYIKLNTNENPYPPAPGMLKIMKNYNADRLKLYPDPDCSRLKKAISEFYGKRNILIDPDQIFIGNGSDEVLAMSFMAFFEEKAAPVFWSDITYSFYPVYADLFKVNYLEIPLRDDFSIDADKFCGIGEKSRAGGIIIANPNAPTGITLKLEEIERIVEANRECIVIIDEAYVDFGADTAVPLVEKYNNLMIIQTFSKSRALAGTRVGFAIASGNLINALETVKNSFNSYTVNCISQELAIAAVNDSDYFKATCEAVISSRERMIKDFRELGFEVTDSKSNFIFVSYKDKPAEEIYNSLRDKGILVRHFNQERIRNHLRISIGTDVEMDVLQEAVKKILKGVCHERENSGYQ